MSKFKDMLEDNIELYDVVLNILLVWKKARKATLVESSNFGGREAFKKYGYHEVLDLIKVLNDIHQESGEGSHLWMWEDPLALDDYPRYLITNDYLKKIPQNDEEMGSILGFLCSIHNYGNYKKDRVALEIWTDNELQIYAELCEKRLLNLRAAKAHLRNKIRMYNRVMKELEIPVKFHGKITLQTGIETLIQKVEENDKEYVWKNWDKYLNYFYNFGYGQLHQFVIDTYKDNEDLENFDLFYYLIQLTKPVDDISIWENYKGDFNEVISFIKGLNRYEVDKGNFKEVFYSRYNLK